MLFVNTDSCISSFPVLMPFISLIALAQILSLMMGRDGDNGDLFTIKYNICCSSLFFLVGILND